MLASPTDLTYFMEVANSGSLSHAAQRLGVTQPTLSQSIKRLEEALGTKILDRHKQGVTMTAGGRQLLLHARILLDQWNDLKKKMNIAHQEVSGSYTVGAHPEVALYSLPQTLPSILSKYPSLEIKLVHGLSRHIVSEVIDLRIDLGIVINPTKHPDLIIKKVRSDVVGFWTSTEGPNPLTDLDSDESVLICDPDLIQTQSLLQKIKSKYKIHRVIHSSNMQLIAELGAAGAGVCLLPECVVQRNHRGKLKLLKSLPTYIDDVCVISRVENRKIKAIQTLFDALVAGLEK